MLDPAAVSNPVLLWLIPTVRLPKSMLVGVSPSWFAANPVPVSDAGAGDTPPLITTDMLPLANPADAGAKVTLRVALWPADNVKGIAKGEAKLKPAPLMFI